jgi:hypothetical protein
LELTLIYLDKEPAKYERAALRWHSHFCVDARLDFDAAIATGGKRPRTQPELSSSSSASTERSCPSQKSSDAGRTRTEGVRRVWRKKRMVILRREQSGVPTPKTR